MVYLYVDGVKIGALNNYFVGATAQGTTSNWISGKDFVFNYMGTPHYTISNVSMDYLEIDEGAQRTGTVVFRDWDGTVISSAVYQYGDTVAVPANPSRPSDNYNNYYFAGWDKTVVACEGDAVYTAIYNTAPIRYTVTFKDWDGTVISSTSYQYGATVAVPADPSRGSDGSYSYTFAGWTPMVTTCTGNAVYTATYTAKALLTITPQYPSLAFEDQIQLNIYFSVENLDAIDLSDMGLLTWTSAQENGTIETAEAVIPGAVASGASYIVHTEGIPAKQMGDMIYFKIYAMLDDGSYVYSRMIAYSPVEYAMYQIEETTDAKSRAMCVALLNYGAAAQTYFNYRTDALMNSALTSEHQALVRGYDESMMDPVVDAADSKMGSFAKNGSVGTFYPAVSFEGAFAINYYVIPSTTVSSGITLYYWYQSAYEEASVLTAANASGAIPMELRNGRYVATVAGIAAKELDKTLYVAVVYRSGINTYCSGVIGYSVGCYLEEIAADSTASAWGLGSAAAVYGYYTKQYFAQFA